MLSIRQPDGLTTIHDYGQPGLTTTNLVLAGHPNEAGTDIDAGTRTTEEFGTVGQLLSRTVVDIESGIMIAAEIREYDDRARLTNTFFLDGTEEEIVHGCCGPLARRDRAGTYTSFSYDPLNRLLTTSRNGVTVSNVLDAAGAVLATVRFGTNGVAITNAASLFDDSGRLRHSWDALANETAYDT